MVMLFWEAMIIILSFRTHCADHMWSWIITPTVSKHMTNELLSCTFGMCTNQSLLHVCLSHKFMGTLKIQIKAKKAIQIGISGSEALYSMSWRLWCDIHQVALIAKMHIFSHKLGSSSWRGSLRRGEGCFWMRARETDEKMRATTWGLLWS